MTGKIALITGGSSGIGQGTALRLARDGWHIKVHGRDRDKLDQTCALIEQAGGSAEPMSAEMSDMDQLAALAEWATKTGRLDALVHCAAKFTYGEVSTDRFADWDHTITAVLRATMRLTAHVLPAVRAAEGAFVYICGPTSWTGWKRHSVHCATRHAQAGFAKALFEEVREDGVRVTLVHPGFVNTPGVGKDGKDPDKMIQMADIAEMIATAITLPNTSCVTELTLRPQRSPYT
ncbi:SDR family NAD(P)-dependent oxidoreductase [Primorskyibacter aestuariivivens]|uniref:SDR family NAD(P)-dependent oxidoreductase n=1 Tax=Primorskyibacter aestuariivivens TaxID=1888912 RepID=UPI002300D5A2|nr:SDR family oxidoreductase [Primorskyibacter aestuariivivens]MDA7427775.1 SDR family NAD(P)-dependent oxidoreductase [Primorskyibacter aestuariivivens]